MADKLYFNLIEGIKAYFKRGDIKDNYGNSLHGNTLHCEKFSPPIDLKLTNSQFEEVMGEINDATRFKVLAMLSGETEVESSPLQEHCFHGIYDEAKDRSGGRTH